MGGQQALDWEDVFLGAAIEPHRWMDALDLMATQTGASHGQLIGIGGGRDLPFNLMTNAEGWPAAELEQKGGYRPEVNFRVAANVHALARGRYDPILHEADYDAAIPGLENRLYLDFCDAIDIPFGCQTNLVLDGDGLIGLATLRSRRDGRTTAVQRRTFARAATAARRAVRLQERLEGEQAKLIAGAFDAMALTAFILDARGAVLACTREAEARIIEGDLALRDRMLDAPGTPMPLARATAALTGEGGVSYMQLRIDLPAERPALFVEGFRLPPRPFSTGRLPHAILVARQPGRDRAGVAGFLAALYGLTAAEADVAMRLYEGKSRETIAGDRSVSIETLRGQIKSIYAKTATGGEAGLIRLLSAIMA